MLLIKEGRVCGLLLFRPVTELEPSSKYARPPLGGVDPEGRALQRGGSKAGIELTTKSHMQIAGLVATQGTYQPWSLMTTIAYFPLSTTLEQHIVRPYLGFDPVYALFMQFSAQAPAYVVAREKAIVDAQRIMAI